MKDINWTQVAVFGGIVVLILACGVSFLPSVLGGGYRSWGMMGGWGRGGMMEGYGPSNMMGSWGIFGWPFMFLMWLFPLGFLILLVLGIVWLVRALSGPGPGRAPVQALPTCPECHRPVQTDWQVCPYCGKGLGQDSEGG